MIIAYMMLIIFIKKSSIGISFKMIPHYRRTVLLDLPYNMVKHTNYISL